MRKKLILAFIALSLGLTACSGGKESSDISENAGEATTEATEMADDKTEESSESENLTGGGADGTLPMGGTFIIPINSDSVENMTPIDAVGGDDEMIAFQPAYDPLFVQSNDGIRFYLAESIEPVTDDGMHFQMKLRDNLKWHDGEEITADDVIFTVNALLEPENNGSSNLVSYKGNDITVEKIDDKTVDIKLQEPYSAFTSMFGRVQLLPEHVFNGNTKIFDEGDAVFKGIGSGPFKLVEYKAGDSIVYERNEDYYRGKAPLDQVIIRVMPDRNAQEAALQTGEISMMRIADQPKLDAYKANDNFAIHSIPEGRLNYMTFNYQSPLMKNEDARKAIALALNVDEIIVGAYGSEELALPAKNFMSPENMYYNDEMTGYEQNIEEAKKLAESSGITERPLNYIYNQQRPNMAETAQIVQQQLAQIGVEVNLEGLDSAGFFPKLFAAWITGETVEDTSWDLATNGFDQMNADPATVIMEYVGPNAGNGFYSSEKTVKLWDEASKETDLEKREDLFKQLQVSIKDDYSMYPMANTNYVMVSQKGFEGLDSVSRVPVFEDYLQIYFEEK